MTEARSLAAGNYVSERWPASLRVSWFALLVVFGGLIQLPLDLAGLSIPLQALARVALVAGAVPVLLVAQEKRGDLAPPSVRLASALVFFSAVISFIKDYSVSTVVSDSIASFLFMYGVGALLILTAIVPVSARFRAAFYILTALSVGFGVIQLFAQQLYLPLEYLESVGILYENFVNDRLRVVSFFRSAPRFAEFLTFLSLVILSQIFLPTSVRLARMRVLLLLAYGLMTILLFNTYSRAGYLLFLSSSIVMLFLIRRWVRGGRGFGPVPSFLLFLTVGVVVILTALDKLPLDRSILDTASYQSRQDSWSMLFSRMNEGSLADLLLGFGEAARFTRGEAGYFIVDNLSLALCLYSGALGLLAAFFISASAVRFAVLVRNVGVRTLEPWIAFIPCLWVEGFFVDNHNTLFISLIAMLGFVCSARRNHELRSRQLSFAGDGSAELRN